LRSSGPYALRESTLWGYAWAAGAQMGVSVAAKKSLRP
jgi:hypothetical protein